MIVKSPSLDQKTAVIEPIAVPDFDRDDFLDQMTKETFHEEIDFDPPVGQEVW